LAAEGKPYKQAKVQKSYHPTKHAQQHIHVLYSFLKRGKLAQLRHTMFHSGQWQVRSCVSADFH